MTERQPISNDKFMSLVEQMLTVGGEWRVSMSKDGTSMLYRGETYPISNKQAEVMFNHIPRPCVAAALSEQAQTKEG